MIKPTPQAPRRNSLLQTLAEAYLERGEFAEAAERFSELLRNGLQTPNVYRNLARALLGLQSYVEFARHIYQRALELFPNERELCVEICKLLLEHKAQDAFALKCYQQTLALHPPAERELLQALAVHLHNVGYEQAAFEIVKRLALLENGDDSKTLTLLTQFGRQLNKQNESRNLLLYLEGRNERAHGVKTMLAFEYARAYLNEEGAPKLGTREWQTITHVTLRYARLESLSVAREYATLRLALARIQSQHQHLQKKTEACEEWLYGSEFLQHLPVPEGQPLPEVTPVFKHVYGLRLCNLAHLETESGETVARNLAQKFLTFAGTYLHKAAQAQWHPLSDGLLAIADSLNVLAHAAVEVLHKIERYNRTAAQGTQLFAQTVLHSTEIPARDSDAAALQSLYEVLHMLEARNPANQLANEYNNRLYVPRVVYEQAFNNDTLPARPTGFLEVPGSEFRLEAYEVVWRNPLDYIQENTPCEFGRYQASAKLRNSRTTGTYRGRDRQLERNVILKTLNPQLSLQLAHDNKWRDEVMETLRRLGRLESPGIAMIYDMGFHENIFFFAREYLEGHALAAAYESPRRFSPTEGLNFALHLCRILSLAHRQGICHGNLKPSNIWLCANDEIKISDFYVPGFLTHSDAESPIDTACARYLSPELFRTYTPTVRSDIYALGMLLYELIAGKHPFAEITALSELQAASLPSLNTSQLDLPPTLDEILARACHKNSDERYQNLVELESALRTVTSSS